MNLKKRRLSNNSEQLNGSIKYFGTGTCQRDLIHEILDDDDCA
jgi:hypothetical protein